MKIPTTDSFQKGVNFIKENPQLLYTLLLVVVIPAAFIINGQIFLNSSLAIQERLEKEKIGMLQDVFSQFATRHINDPGFLQNRIEEVVELNPTIETFQILIKELDVYRVIAASQIESVGIIEDDIYLNEFFDFAREDRTFAFQVMEENDRYWYAVREIRDPAQGVEGILLTKVSMAHIDELIASKINTAYLFLIAIILLVVGLLIRHAKIIDYAALYQKLKEVDKMKDTFVSIAAHELRTPLTIIRGYTELLSNMKLNKEQQEIADNIALSSDQLNLLVNDILDVARIQQGRLSMKIENSDISDILREVVTALDVTAKEKGLIVEWKNAPKSLPQISVDTTRIKQIFLNIAGNAVKYTKEGFVDIKTNVLTDQKKLEIRISDTGIGISAEDQEKLFHRFYRVQSEETAQIRGTGLGLWISKRMIEQMDGTITVESIKGKGTDFIMTFPLRDASKQA